MGNKSNHSIKTLDSVEDFDREHLGNLQKRIEDHIADIDKQRTDLKNLSDLRHITAIQASLTQAKSSALQALVDLYKSK